MPNWWDSQIYSVSTQFTGLKRLSPGGAAPGFFADYNEFAFYVPAGDRILYGRTLDAGGGIDYWLMKPDGSGQQRLTFMNEPWHAQARGRAVAGGMAFDPHDRNRFVAGVAADSFAHEIDAVMVDMERYDERHGLRGRYFSDSSLGRLVRTRVDNPAAGVKWTGSPAPGVPADGFSVRWSGSVTAPRSGRYTYCVHADDGARLWVGGHKVIDAWQAWPGRHCGAVTHRGGRPTAIRLEFVDRGGDASAQLTWTGPGTGSRAQRAIPVARLRPAAAARGAAVRPKASGRRTR
jgi:hypothetical protein